MKFNKKIFKKKQAVLATLIAVLGVAIYLNWQFSQADENFAVSGLLSAETTSSSSAKTKNYGDALLVDGKNTTESTSSVASSSGSDDYFASARLNRSKTRDEAAAAINKILDNSSATKDEKEVAANKAVLLTQTSDNETKIENLIKAKGFSECVVFLNDDSADIVVKTSGLSPEQAAQIKDIVLNTVEIPVENIRIVEVN